MKTSQKEELILMFSQYSPAEIAANKSNEILKIMEVSDPIELASSEDYAKFYKNIQEISEEVEEIQLAPSEADQVKQALKLLNEKIKDESKEMVDATFEIIKGKLHNNWQEKTKDFYFNGIKLISDWIHFFISYTNSSRPGVNNYFKSLLKSDLEAGYIKKNKENMNLIAALLYKYFKMQRVTTFYDKEKIDWSDNFKDVMFSYCSKSFAFVQFVETEIFQQNQDQNYCYKEYASYCKAIQEIKKQYKLSNVNPYYFFIVSNPENIPNYDFKPAYLPDDFESWVKCILDSQYITLHDKIRPTELRLKIQEAATEIVNMRKLLFEDYLNSLSN